MVYNEGFDILIKDRSYFAFSKYSKNNNEKKNINTKWVSQCYSTLIGWYHIGKHKWGCFYAKKIVENPEKVTNGETDGKLVVVEGTVKKIDTSVEDSQKSFENSRFKSIDSKISIMDKKIVTNLKLENKNNKNKKIVIKEEADEIIDSLSSQLSFIETSEKLNISADFKDHKQVVDKINSMTDLWEAKNYNEFASMTIEQLNNYAGRKKIAKDQINTTNDQDDLLQTFTSYSGLKNIKKQNSKRNFPQIKNNKKTFLNKSHANKYNYE